MYSFTRYVEFHSMVFTVKTQKFMTSFREMELTHMKACLSEAMYHCNLQLLQKYEFKTWWVWREVFWDKLRKQAAEHHTTAWRHEQNVLLGSHPACENMESCTGQCHCLSWPGMLSYSLSLKPASFHAMSQSTCGFFMASAFVNILFTNIFPEIQELASS